MIHAMERVLTFVVIGEAQPQGSATAWVPTDKAGNPYRRAASPRNPRGAIIVNVTTDNKDLKKWREQVARAAIYEFDQITAKPAFPLEGVGFTVEAISYLQRPQGHWGTGRNAAILKPGAPAYPLVTPDVDKLLRAFLDALTGVAWKDDSQVTDATTRKRYALPTSSENDGVMAGVSVWINGAQTADALPEADRVRWVPGPPGQVTLDVPA